MFIYTKKTLAIDMDPSEETMSMEMNITGVFV